MAVSEDLPHNPSKRRKFWPLVLRIVVAIALFAWLGTHLDWNAIAHTMSTIDTRSINDARD